MLETWWFSIITQNREERGSDVNRRSQQNQKPTKMRLKLVLIGYYYISFVIQYIYSYIYKTELKLKEIRFENFFFSLFSVSWCILPSCHSYTIILTPHPNIVSSILWVKVMVMWICSSFLLHCSFNHCPCVICTKQKRRALLQGRKGKGNYLLFLRTLFMFIDFIFLPLFIFISKVFSYIFSLVSN